MRDYYLRWFPGTKLKVIYNGIPDQRKDTISHENIIQKVNQYHSKDLTVIGVVCSLNKGKGVDILLQLLAETSEFALIVFGNGREYLNLKDLTLKLNIIDRCYFPGFIKDAVNYLKYLDLIVVPSRSEGFCLSLVETVQQNVPVVCSDIDVFKELFDEEEVTFFNLGSVRSLLNSLHFAKSSARSKVDFAYAKYRNQYTSLFMAKQYMELYQSV